jgi:DNA primase
MQWVDFKTIKSSVSIEAVLGRYGVQLRRVNETSFRAVCPLPSHTSKGAPSFCVNSEKGAWSCKSESCVQGRGGGSTGGNILDFVAVMERCSVRDAAIKIAEWFNISMPAGTPISASKKTPQPDRPPEEVAEKKRGGESRENNLPTPENKPLGFSLKGIVHNHPYLINRGVSPETAEAFGAGFFPGRGSMAGRIVIPIHNERGELVAYAGRAIDDTEPKYKFPAGFVKAEVLFNLDRTIAEKIIVVVEGFFDCMKVTAAGWPCVAIMGSSMSATQEKLLATHFTAAWLMFDGDDAGRNATREILTRLARIIFARVVALADGVQPDMLQSDELNRILKK